MTDYRRINAKYDVDTGKTIVSLSKPFKKLDIDKQKERQLYLDNKYINCSLRNSILEFVGFQFNNAKIRLVSSIKYSRYFLIRFWGGLLCC